jgi:pimeloyl-ACP methyl ester carboxylesterase
MTQRSGHRVASSARGGAVTEFGRDGWRCSVHDRGRISDETYILLHGFPGGAETWDDVADGLVANRFRVLAPNQRGYAEGARPREVDAYALPELAADVLALADAAGVDRFHLAGHDWGGFVAWYLAAHHPERLASVAVLSTPHPRALGESMLTSLQPLRSSYVAAFQVPVLPERLLTLSGGRMLRNGLRASGLPGSFAESYTQRMMQPGALTGALNWYRAAIRHPHHLRTVDSITAPVLYVWSNRDVALGGTAARRTARHVSGPYRFVVLDLVPHWIPETRPAELVTLLTDHARPSA